MQPQKESTRGKRDVGGPQGDETFTTVLVIGFSEIVKYNPIILCNTLLKAELLCIQWHVCFILSVSVGLRKCQHQYHQNGTSDPTILKL